MSLEIKNLLIKSNIDNRKTTRNEELKNNVDTIKCNSCMTNDSIKTLLNFLIEAKGSARER